jgi:hypothetical protein
MLGHRFNSTAFSIFSESEKKEALHADEQLICTVTKLSLFSDKKDV